MICNQNFPEIDLQLLKEADWKVDCCNYWSFDENIIIGEARALVSSLRVHVFRKLVRGKRVLFLVDNMSVCLAFSRFRSSNFKLLVQIRKWAAMCLAFNIFPSVRWVPSEYNVSDAPSRDPSYFMNNVFSCKSLIQFP